MKKTVPQKESKEQKWQIQEKKTLMTKITGKQKEQNVLEIPLKTSRGQIKKGRKNTHKRNKNIYKH